MNICSWKNEVQVFSIPNIYPWDQRWTCRAELLCFYQLYLLGKKYWWTMCQLNLQYALVMLALSYLRLAFRTQEKQLPLKKSSRKHGIGRLTDRQTDRQTNVLMAGRIYSLRKKRPFSQPRFISDWTATW